MGFEKDALGAAQEWDAAVANWMPAWLWALASVWLCRLVQQRPLMLSCPGGGSRWLLDPGRMGPTSLNPLLG